MVPTLLRVVTGGLLAVVVTSGPAARPADPAAAAPLRDDAKGRADRMGDPLPPGAVARLGTVRFRHEDWGGGTLTFLPDGKTLVSISQARSIQFWEARTGRLLRTLSTGEFYINGFALSRDGKRIALGGSDRPEGAALPTASVRILDATTGKVLDSFPRGEQDAGTSWLTFTPDGKHVISGGENGLVRIEEIASGKEILRQKFPRDYNRLALSQDGSTIALASGPNTHKLYLWKWESGEEPRELKAPRYAGTDLAFSPDGKLLAELGDVGVTLIRVWDVAGGTIRHKLEPPPAEEGYWSRHLAFAPDGKTLAASGYRRGYSGAIHFWDPATGRFKGKIEVSDSSTGVLAFSPDSRLIATSTGNSLRVWEVASGKEVAGNEEAHQGTLTRLAVAANGLVATASDDHTARVWDATTGQQKLKLLHDHWVRAVAVSPDGTRLVSSSLDDTVRLWDLGNGRQIYRLPGHGELGGNRVVSFTADGKRFLSFGDDFYLRVWDVRTGKAVLEHKIRPAGIPVPDEDDDEARRGKLDFYGEGAFSADGKMFVVLAGGKASVFDVETGKEVRQFATELRNSDRIAISPDGKLLLAGGWGKSIQTPLPDGRTRFTTAPEHPLELWDLTTGKPVRQLMLPGSISGPVAFSADGKTYAAAINDKPEAKIRIWNTATGEEQPGISGIPGAVSALGFSPDGKRLVTGLRDTTALVWDLTAAK
jgi:WD40 repeat protein